MTPQYGRLEDI